MGLYHIRMIKNYLHIFIIILKEKEERELRMPFGIRQVVLVPATDEEVISKILDPPPIFWRCPPSET